MPTRNVYLTEHFDQFIESGIGSGRFSDASEIVGEGLRLLEEHDQNERDQNERDQDERAKLEWLRAAAKEGADALDSGDFTEIRSETELTSFMESIHREAVSDASPNGNV